MSKLLNTPVPGSKNWKELSFHPKHCPLKYDKRDSAKKISGANSRTKWTGTEQPKKRVSEYLSLNINEGTSPTVQSLLSGDYVYCVDANEVWIPWQKVG